MTRMRRAVCQGCTPPVIVYATRPHLAATCVLCSTAFVEAPPAPRRIRVHPDGAGTWGVYADGVRVEGGLSRTEAFRRARERREGVA